jgi:alpha-L-fucosidase
MQMSGGRIAAGLVAGLMALCAAAPAPAQDAPSHYEPTAESLAEHPLPHWYDDAKFGIFIHWGVYSVPAYAPVGPAGIGTPLVDYAEWYWRYQQQQGSATWEHHLDGYGPNFVYDDFIPQFRAERWDPRAWVKLFQDAGAKYFVLTSKHHDGFALYPSAVTHRNAMEMGPRRDLVGDLFAAARKYSDLHPGLYYSLPEWFNPLPIPPGTNGPTTGPPLFGLGPPRNAYTGQEVPYTGQRPGKDYAADLAVPQMREIVDRYHPDVLWCDIGGNPDYYRSNQTIAHYYNEAAVHNPDGVAVNGRCGDNGTHADFGGTEYGVPIGAPAKKQEATQAMGTSFGYNAQETEAHYLRPGDLIDLLINDVSKDTNLLLDIGPRADGTIPEPMTMRLKEIGDWLTINGESIYGSRPWTQPTDTDNSNVVFTVGKTGAFYMTALTWPGKELTVNAPVPLEDDSQIVLLGSDGTPLKDRREGGKLIVTMPAGGDQFAATQSRYAFVLRIAPPKFASPSVGQPRVSPTRALRARLALKVSSRRLGTRALRLTSTGQLRLPAGLTTTCSGAVTIRSAAGRNTLAKRRVPLSRTCRFRSATRLRTRVRRVTVSVRFAGSGGLEPATTRRTVRAP